MSQWAVAVTRPNCELRVEGHLTRQGFVVYAPKIRERITLGGKLCNRQAPLFRRYLFVDADQAPHAISRTFGVVGLLRSNISSSIIEDLKMRHNSDGFVQLPRFNQGDKVRITHGPFAGHLALYQGMTSKQRESVLLAALNVRLELTVGNLETAVAA